MSNKPTIADNITSLLDEAMELMKPAQSKDIQHNHDERHIWDIKEEYVKPTIDYSQIKLGHYVRCRIPILYKHNRLVAGKLERNFEDVLSTFDWYEVIGVYHSGFKVRNDETNMEYIICNSDVDDFSTETEKPCELCEWVHENNNCQAPY
tara:strand:+ start:571 stop:1020 length:450 start_codon:yes stop_codon:yes gene_type:complete